MLQQSIAAQAGKWDLLHTMQLPVRSYSADPGVAHGQAMGSGYCKQLQGIQQVHNAESTPCYTCVIAVARLEPWELCMHGQLG